MPSRLLLLRHAQSTWNAEGRWQGWADPPLSPAGEAAARRAGADPVFASMTAAVSSDLQRARRTAELIAAPHEWPPVRTFRGLRERGAGAWTGLTRSEIEDGWPRALSGSVPDIPGGESPAAVTGRAVASLHRVAAEWPDAAVLVVTHGALIRLVEHHCGTEPAHVTNLSGRWVEVDGGRLHLGEAAAIAAPAPTH